MAGIYICEPCGAEVLLREDDALLSGLIRAGVACARCLGAALRAACAECAGTGVIEDIDDDGMDEDGAPILRPIQLRCRCQAAL